MLLTVKVCERLANFRKVFFGYGYQNEPAVLGFLIIYHDAKIDRSPNPPILSIVNA